MPDPRWPATNASGAVHRPHRRMLFTPMGLCSAASATNSWPVAHPRSSSTRLLGLRVTGVDMDVTAAESDALDPNV